MAPRTNTAPIVRYKELIARANCEGLTSILTELVQIPCEANKNVAIAHATVTFEIDGVTRVFRDYGDANPLNVSAEMAKCLIRMAVTRAKARCLRDALGVGDVAAEEMENFNEGESARRPTAVAAGKVNDSGAQCPTCHAPAGKNHVKPCI